MTSSVEKYKEEIANKYMKNFKKELSFFEKIMILPIEGKMEKILKSDKKITIDNFSDLEDLGFRRNVLGIKIFDKKIFENLTTKIFKFLKEKQEKIIQAETEGKLSELLTLIIEGKMDDLNYNVDNNGDNNEGNGDNNEGNGDNNEGNGDNNEGNGDNNEGNGDNNEGNGDNNEGNGDNNEGNGEGGNSHAIETGVGGGAGAATVYYRAISSAEKKLGINRSKEIPKEFDGARTKEIMNDLADEMEAHLNGNKVKMNKVQIKVYNKSIKQFRESAKALNGDTAEAFRAWQKLSDRLDPRFLKTMHINSGVLNAIDDLPDSELNKIIGKNEDEIVSFLKREHNIDISKSFAKQLKVAGGATEVRQITNIARHGRKLANILKGIKGMGVVTFLFAGLDLRSYIDSNDEAKMVSKINKVRGKILSDQAQTQLIIGLSAVGLEALTIVVICAAGGSVVGPWGTAIGVAIGVIAAAASVLFDSLYYDSKTFYAQNRYDFINKKRTEIKQSIIQLLQSDRLGMNEGMKKSIKDDRGPNSEIDTMEDAWEALIYQEESLNGGFGYLQQYYSSGESEQEFLNKLTEGEKENYRTEKIEMEKIINIRMEYIKQFIKDDKNSEEYKKMKNALDRKEGMLFVEQILADSKIYSYLKSDDESPYVSNYKSLDVEGYKQAYRNKLSSEYPQEFAKFEKLKQDNPILLREICRGVDLSKDGIISDIEESTISEYLDSEKTNIKKNADFIGKYYEYIQLGLPGEKTLQLGLSSTTFDYGYIEQVLLNINTINKRPKWKRENSLEYMGYEIDERVEEIGHYVSDSIFQNIIYSIAKEVHGYTGRNDALELVNFYSGNGDITGIYMDNKRKISKVTGFLFFGAKDGSVDNPNIITKDEILKELVREVELDTEVECADDMVTQEFRNRIETIVNREFSYSEKKKDYENKLINYIKSQGESDYYIEIPLDIVLECYKAGIGDLSKFLFKYSGGKIYALGRGDMIHKNLNFDKTNAKIRYESILRLRQSYTEEEKSLIKEVDNAEQLLLNIRKLEGSELSGTKEDELDIPVELERLMSQKSIEWNEIKESILYMEPHKSRDYLSQKAKEYHDFFNGMYIGILSVITSKNAFLNSNDVDEASEFLRASYFIGANLAYVDKGEIKFINIVDSSVGEYLIKLLDLYKDETSGKTIKELLLSDDEELQSRGQELLTELYKLCLEQTVIEYDDDGNVKDFHMGDMNDNDFEKVKEKMKYRLDKVCFISTRSTHRLAPLPTVGEYKTRRIETQEEIAHKKVKEITDKIINTMYDIDRAGFRKNPKFEADEQQNIDGVITGTFNSWGYKEKISIILNGEDIKEIKIDGLDEIEFCGDIEESLRTANFINFIKYNIKENPYGKSADDRARGTYGYYHRSNGGDLERDVENNMNDVNILDCDTAKKYFYMIWKDEDFLSYINGFVR